MTTRERILEEALNLFSEKGYEGVSVRDIACRVGIKDSSLYNHFRSKRQIFDTIVEECCQRAEQYFQERSLPFNLDDDISMYYNTPFERLEKMIIATFGYFFEDSHNVRFRKLLLLSQYEDEKARKIYRQLYCEYPLEFQSRLFEKLIQSGEFSRIPSCCCLRRWRPWYAYVRLARRRGLHARRRHLRCGR